VPFFGDDLSQTVGHSIRIALPWCEVHPPAGMLAFKGDRHSAFNKTANDHQHVIANDLSPLTG